jgi:hypothetical protein
VTGRWIGSCCGVQCGHGGGLASPTGRDIRAMLGAVAFLSGGWYELHSVLMSFTLQDVKFALFASTVEFVDTLIHPPLSFCDQSIVKAGQNPSHGFDCF